MLVDLNVLGEFEVLGRFWVWFGEKSGMKVGSTMSRSEQVPSEEYPPTGR